MTEIITAGVTALVVAYIGYLGVKHTNRVSREANADNVTVAEQDRTVKALEDMTLNLLQPYVDETERLRKRVAEMERSREAERREYEVARETEREERERKATEIQEQLTLQSERIDLLTEQVGEWKRLAQTIARWATRLRDEVLRLGGAVPATPEELLTLQAIEDAHRDTN